MTTYFVTIDSIRRHHPEIFKTKLGRCVCVCFSVCLSFLAFFFSTRCFSFHIPKRHTYSHSQNLLTLSHIHTHTGQFVASAGAATFGFWVVWPLEVLKVRGKTKGLWTGESVVGQSADGLCCAFAAKTTRGLGGRVGKRRGPCVVVPSNHPIHPSTHPCKHTTTHHPSIHPTHPSTHPQNQVQAGTPVGPRGAQATIWDRVKSVKEPRNRVDRMI